MTTSQIAGIGASVGGAFATLESRLARLAAEALDAVGP